MIDKDLILIDHLDELRKRMIISALAFLLFFLIGFVFVKDIFYFFLGNLDYKLFVLGPSDILWVYFHIAAIIALTGAIPVTTWQIWLFVKPALKPFERKIALMYIPPMFLLFIVGLAFGYFFIFPNIMEFIHNLGRNLTTESFTAEKYLSFLINMTLPFGIAFELPLVSMFLTTLGLINPYKIVKIRKYAYFILVIIASMISPPEFISNISVAIPLILLFEISIFIAKIVHKRRLKQNEIIKT